MWFRMQASALVVLLFIVCIVQPACSVYDPVLKLESARIYGNVDAFAYYYIDLVVGSPTPQLASVIIDTGSNIAGFPCANCDHCGKHINAPFDISASQTAHWLQCSSMCSYGCAKNRCTYQQTYTEGSSITGFFFQDKMQIGDLVENNPAVVAQMGCHTKETKLFYTQRANGILGLAPRLSAVNPTILGDLFKDTSHVNNQVFSICLATWGGAFNVGGFNQTYHTGILQWISMGLSRYYTIQISQLQLVNKIIASTSAEFGTCMLDSGTTYTYFPEKLFKDLDAAIDAHCSGGKCGAHHDGSCWILADASQGPTMFPTLTFSFNGATIDWPAHAYLYQRGSSSKWCRAYASNGKTHATVLGSTFMKGKEVIFDLANRRCGMAPANCPNHKRSPHTVQSRLLTDRRLEHLPNIFV